MTATLTQSGYEQTKRKLVRLEERLATISERTDIKSLVRNEAARSCRQMIAQYRREIKLFEATHADAQS